MTLQSLLVSPFQRDHDTYWLTSLRGVAALGVVFAHIHGFFPDAPRLAKLLMESGRHGVQLFFILSAFSIALSLSRGRDTFGAYMTRRFFRIFPLYAAVLLAIWALGLNGSSWGTKFGVQPDGYSLFLHLSLLNLLDVRHANNFIGAEWSISIEFFYYFCLPLMVALARTSLWRLAGLTAAITALAFVVPFRTLQTNHSLMLLWSFPVYAAIYAWGAALVVRVDTVRPWLRRYLRSDDIALGVLTTVLLAMVWLDIPGKPVAIVVGFGLLFAALQGDGVWLRRLLGNRVLMFLGNISFSIYLIHFVLLNNIPFATLGWGALTGWAIVGLVIGSSYLLYCLIEKPFLDWGRRLARGGVGTGS